MLDDNEVIVVVVLLVLELFEELDVVTFELDVLVLDERTDDVVLELDVLFELDRLVVATEEVLFEVDVVLTLDVLLILDVLVATTEEEMEDVQPPTILGTASVPLPIATILVPQFAACAKCMLKLS